MAVAALSGTGELGRRGDSSRVFRWASVSKPVVALAALVAAEEGTIDLDEPAGPPGSTIRHLLAHTSGLPFEPGPPIAKPGTRRIYSNPGYEALAERLAENAEMPFEEYLQKSVLSPLGMQAYHRYRMEARTARSTTRRQCEFMEPMLVARDPRGGDARPVPWLCVIRSGPTRTTGPHFESRRRGSRISLGHHLAARGH